MQTHAPPLDYAPAPSKRRKWIWRGVVFVGLVIAALTARHYLPIVRQRVQLLSLQRECLNHTEPEDRVVYEEDRSAVSQLLQRPDYSRYVSRWVRGNASPAIYTPACWHPYALGARLYAAVGRANGGLGAIVFLHERRSSGGERRLVCIEYAPSYFPARDFPRESLPMVVTPAKLTGEAVLDMSNLDHYRLSSNRMGMRIESPPNIRVYAGQVDPNTASHVTIRYEMWGQTDVIDGWLLDGNDISLAPRKRPQPPNDPTTFPASRFPRSGTSPSP
jgi:hypothetical protein